MFRGHVDNCNLDPCSGARVPNALCILEKHHVLLNAANLAAASPRCQYVADAIVLRQVCNRKTFIMVSRSQLPCMAYDTTADCMNEAKAEGRNQCIVHE
jgi:hypothetical protein